MLITIHRFIPPSPTYTHKALNSALFPFPSTSQVKYALPQSRFQTLFTIPICSQPRIEARHASAQRLLRTRNGNWKSYGRRSSNTDAPTTDNEHKRAEVSNELYTLLTFLRRHLNFEKVFSIGNFSRFQGYSSAGDRNKVFGNDFHLICGTS